MNTDIESVLISASSRAAIWSEEQSLEVGRAIASEVGGRVDWDWGAGEDWIRVLPGDGDFLIIRRDFPFLIKSHRISLIVDDGVEVVEVPHMYEPCLRCATQVLESVFPGRFPVSDWDPEAFSAHDLWWATI